MLKTKSLYLRNSLTLVVSLFIILAAWWLYLNPFSNDPSLVNDKYIWGSCYQIIAIVGGIIGLILSHYYGGFKSWLGKAIAFFAIGLLLQSFGQSVYSYFNIVAKIEAPYPSIGDVGFFGTIISYILGVSCLARVAGFKVSWKSLKNKLYSIIIPLILLVASYVFFLRDYVFDWSNALKIFLDFGYPLGEAVYVSIAVLTLVVSMNVLGGIMRKLISFLLVALVVQYISDFNFLFQANNGSWYVAGVGDFLYMFSYLMMTIALINFASAFEKIKNS